MSQLFFVVIILGTSPFEAFFARKPNNVSVHIAPELPDTLSMCIPCGLPYEGEVLNVHIL